MSSLYGFKIKVALLFSALFSSLSLLAACENAGMVKESKTQEATPAQTSNVEIDGALGKLSAVVYRPELQDGEKTLLVVLMHGFTSNKQERVMTAIASGLQKKGIAYIRFDFNGHGESEGDFQNMTVANEIEDAKKVYKYARSLDFVSDIALL